MPTDTMVKKWCNSQPDEEEHKLTFEAVLQKAKEHEAAVREYIYLAEENATMTTAFQQTKQVATDIQQETNHQLWFQGTHNFRWHLSSTRCNLWILQESLLLGACVDQEETG